MGGTGRPGLRSEVHLVPVAAHCKDLAMIRYAAATVIYAVLFVAEFARERLGRAPR
jgi:hypothetical protein